MSGETSDLFIIGGGINGVGIARDAVGRGLTVRLAEMGDLASATSSASTKLFHGGLRYLEYFEFRLVRMALAEREVLWQAMPHIAHPMRFVLPLSPDMRFDLHTPASRLLGLVMPWLKGRRPDFMIRFGLFLYDHLGGRRLLPGTRRLDLTKDAAGEALKPEFRAAFEYSDCWVDDARLVVLNACDARARGADILTRTKVISARRRDGFWEIDCESADGTQRRYVARALVNAAGPYVRSVIDEVLDLPSQENVRLVRGSHIITRRLASHDRSYFLQGPDGRIIFAIPYEDDFTLIGTTDQDHSGPPASAACSDTERDYLCAFASRYFRQEVRPEDVIATYSGVRPLYADGAKSATAATRDYVLSLNEDGPPVLHVFGGKITTYRKLAEAALARLSLHFPQASGVWTAGVPLPGGDFKAQDFEAELAKIERAYPFLGSKRARRMFKAYGTRLSQVLGDATSATDLGEDLGAGLTRRELGWLVAEEFAQTAEDVLWRRSKLGLHDQSPEFVARVEAALR